MQDDAITERLLRAVAFNGLVHLPRKGNWSVTVTDMAVVKLERTDERRTSIAETQCNGNMLRAVGDALRQWRLIDRGVLAAMPNWCVPGVTTNDGLPPGYMIHARNGNQDVVDKINVVAWNRCESRCTDTGIPFLFVTDQFSNILELERFLDQLPASFVALARYDCDTRSVTLLDGYVEGAKSQCWYERRKMMEQALERCVPPLSTVTLEPGVYATTDEELAAHLDVYRRAKMSTRVRRLCGAYRCDDFISVDDK